MDANGAPRAERPGMAARDLDLVLYGATGFTGRLVAEYLLEHGPPGLRWALAGRSPKKLEALRAELSQRFLTPELPILVADAADRAALGQLARSTRVVCSTVGPYLTHGEPLVAACATSGTHYCDLSGEVPFIRRMIDAHEAEARATGARIVHACGFDAIPSDLGALMLGDALQTEGFRPTRIRTYLGESKGGVSGGTVASLLNLIEAFEADPNVRGMIRHPYALCPQASGPDGLDQIGVGYDRTLGSWTGPFVMSVVNARVVRRSMALRGHPYGTDFRYAEATSTGVGWRGFLRAVLWSAGTAGLVIGAAIRPLRRYVAASYLPKPGAGPSPSTIDQGHFVFRLVGEGVSENGDRRTMRGVVSGERDPGYGETAKMVGEAALCLALDAEQLPVGGGSWTPASAMGTLLIERLRKAGMTFRVDTTGG